MVDNIFDGLPSGSLSDYERDAIESLADFFEGEDGLTRGGALEKALESILAELFIEKNEVLRQAKAQGYKPTKKEVTRLTNIQAVMGILYDDVKGVEGEDEDTATMKSAFSRKLIGNVLDGGINET